jgi:hypothetical protein
MKELHMDTWWDAVASRKRGIFHKPADLVSPSRRADAAIECRVDFGSMVRTQISLNLRRLFSVVAVGEVPAGCHRI